MAGVKEHRVLCPHCGRVFSAHVSFPYFRPTYLHRGEPVYSVVCSVCRNAEQAQPGNPHGVAVAPDLDDQFEGLLDTVWRCEADWRLLDRLDLLDRHTR